MAKGTRIKKSMPIRHSSHIKETDSRAILVSAINPWMIVSWIESDYGIDGIIEINKNIAGSKDQIVTGKRFSLQLKSTESITDSTARISLNLAREKINYWYGAIEPVIIVLVDLKTATCYFRHIDDELIGELSAKNRNWISQDSVTINFSRELTLSPQKLLAIEEYVIHWKRPPQMILTPGNYFLYNKNVSDYIAQFKEQTDKFHIPFFKKEIEELTKKTEQTIFTIAVAGPSRAGKSTLINAFLYQEVSPVGTFPTTALPISIYPRDKNISEITFKDGRKIEGPVTDSFLKEYTEQTNNPDNTKGVSMVSVSIINNLLERGFALRDVPGLDDPDEEIRTITKTALCSANAVLYVINTAPMKDGGFSLTKQIIEDLKNLGSQIERLFIVFNKVDVLDENSLEQLKQYVSITLEKYGIAKYLPVDPMYISAQKSLMYRTGTGGSDQTVKDLEESIWKLLLSQNKSGLNKLLGIYADSKTILSQLRNVLKSHLLNADKRMQLENEITSVQKEIPNLSDLVSQRKTFIQARLEEFLKNHFENVIEYLHNDLNSIPLEKPLHENEVISNWLKTQAQNVFPMIYKHLEQDIFQLQSEINTWVSVKLKQVEIQINPNSIAETSKMPDINNYLGHIVCNFQSTTSKTVGILEGLIAGIIAVLGDIFTAIEKLLTSDMKIRKQQITEIIRMADHSTKKVEASFVENLKNYLDEVCRVIEEKSLDRAGIYLGTLSRQLSVMDSTISQLDLDNYKNVLNGLDTIEISIERDYLYLKEYTDGVRPFR